MTFVDELDKDDLVRRQFQRRWQDRREDETVVGPASDEYVAPLKQVYKRHIPYYIRLTSMTSINVIGT
jgi:hypothetical protein